jgi:uncharacterized protein
LAKMTRRTAMQGCLTLATAAASPFRMWALSPEFGGGRPLVGERLFTSPAIEAAIQVMQEKIADSKLAAMFERCFPNTLDTTVHPGFYDGKSDTFVVTGDIDAMWLRDSTSQVWPYLPFAKQDPQLCALLEGVVRRQARMVLTDPYANAFARTTSDPPLEWAVHDQTEKVPGVAERKWEVDSLCFVMRLAHGYWRATGKTDVFDSEWKAAAWKMLDTFTAQQRIHGRGPYCFERQSANPYDTVPLGGFGNPARPVGMIFSMFRPSDDACIYPLLVPSNLFAVCAIGHLEEMAVQVLGDPKLAAACDELSSQVRAALQQYGTCRHPQHGEIFAYETDGYGNVLMMDDANAPCLLSLPYLGACDVHNPIYQRTRQFALSSANPYFFKGTAAQGVGGPHVGLGMIWPLGLMLRVLTSTDDREILECLRWLRDTTADTGFMHESFDANNPRRFTRPWFAWANTLFGEMMLTLAQQRPALLRSI